MSIFVPPGEVNKFIGLFVRVNAKTPQARPDTEITGALVYMAISRGMLKIVMDSGKTVDINVPPDETVDDTTYENFLPMLVNAAGNLLQVQYLIPQLTEAMQADGFVADASEPLTRICRLKASVGELDQF